MAPRLSRLASTISRDDIIAVIGASSWSIRAVGAGSTGGGSAFLGLRLIPKCLPIKRAAAKGRSLTLSSIYPFLSVNKQALVSGGNGDEHHPAGPRSRHRLCHEGARNP